MKLNILVFAFILLVGCAGASYTIQPLQTPIKGIDKICVVDNPNLSNNIQGLVNRNINSQGFTSFPISSPTLIKEIGCKVYITYGGTTATDIVSFIESFNIVVYNNEHQRIGSANGKIPNNLNLGKWAASEKLIQDMISQVFPRSHAQRGNEGKLPR